jgi:hypothetical protein
MNRPTPPPAQRKPYEKPVLHTVDLHAEEVLAQGCKLQTGGPSRKNLGCNRGGCFRSGS